MSTNSGLDLITVGRSSVDLYGQQVGGRLEDMSSFAKYVGGSPTNTAIGAQRLGLKTGLVTRVGDDHMGRFILETLEGEGVVTSAIRRDPQRLTALVVLGILDKDTFPLIFYRDNCADMALDRADLDLDWLRTSKAVLVNGTHLSRENVYAASLLAAQTTKAAGGKVIFDIDYRPVLWGLTNKDQGENRYVAAADVTQKLLTVAPLCDLIIGTEEEIRILGGDDDLARALGNIRATSAAIIVCKAGADGCLIFADAVEIDQALKVPGYAVDVLNVLGAGDAFAAGFVSGWLRDADLETCGRRGNAAGALVVSRHGCAPAMPTEEELDLFMNAQAWPVDAALRRHLEDLNWAQRRPKHYDVLKVLAIDHRVQLEELAESQGADAGRINAFKRLALQAVDAVADGDGRFGILLDGRFGGDALMEAAAFPYWIGRPIEVPKSRPIAFEGSPDVGMEIATWPLNHVVKCLVAYHPDDPEALRLAQEAQLLRLQDACRKTDHELLLEIIPPADMPADSLTISRVLERFYDIGIRPDWWKLEPQTDQASWQRVQAAIDAHDPHCRGVLILGLNAPESDLVRAFETAAGFSCIKGFAVGRTIFQDVAVSWLAGTLSDAEAVSSLSRRFLNLIEAWTQVRSAQEQAA